jgi:hypothetical protein
MGATIAGDGIGRRTFLVQSGILAAIAALSACGLSSGDVTAPSIPSNTSISVSNYPSLANVGGVAMVTIGSAPLAIVRTGTSSFVALSRVCPHQGYRAVAEQRLRVSAAWGDVQPVGPVDRRPADEQPALVRDLVRLSDRHPHHQLDKNDEIDRPCRLMCRRSVSSVAGATERRAGAIA